MLGGDFNPGHFDDPRCSRASFASPCVSRRGCGRAATSGVWVDTLRADLWSAFVTRTVATVVCMLGVVAVFAVGRRLGGTAEGLAAAATLSFAFPAGRIALRAQRRRRAGRRRSRAQVVATAERSGQPHFVITGVGLAVGLNTPRESRGPLPGPGLRRASGWSMRSISSDEG